MRISLLTPSFVLIFANAVNSVRRGHNDASGFRRALDVIDQQHCKPQARRHRASCPSFDGDGNAVPKPYCTPHRSPDYCPVEESFGLLIQKRTKTAIDEPQTVTNHGHLFHLLEDKVQGYLFSTQVANVLAPKLFFCSSDIENALIDPMGGFDLSSLSGASGFVIRATNKHSSKGVYVFPQQDYGMELLRGMTMTAQDVTADLLQLGADKIIIEEYIAGNGGSGSVPTEYKAHVIDGKVESINIVYNRGDACACWAEVDTDFNRLDKWGCFTPTSIESNTTDNNGICYDIDFEGGRNKAYPIKGMDQCEEVKKECIDDIVAVAEKLGQLIGAYIRVDMFISNDGEVVVQEYTTNHMSGTRHCSAKVLNGCVNSCFLGQAWQNATLPTETSEDVHYGGPPPSKATLSSFLNILDAAGGTRDEMCDYVIGQTPLVDPYPKLCSDSTSPAPFARAPPTGPSETFEPSINPAAPQTPNPVTSGPVASASASSALARTSGSSDPITSSPVISDLASSPRPISSAPDISVPSDVPSNAPTKSQSSDPTLSVPPSTVPSDSPTFSVGPSQAPSELPSGSMGPSRMPSFAPTASSYPSGTPSESPSDTPAPVTTAPVTAAPVTAAPVTAAPVTAAPVTTAPVLTAPVTPAPVTPAPVTPAPVTPAPVTSSPVTPAPATSSPVTPAPVTPAPVTSAPVTSTPVTSAPVASAPCTSGEDVCDDCETICGSKGDGMHMVGDTLCCNGVDACKKDEAPGGGSDYKAPSVNGKICCRGEKACSSVNLQIGRGGLCCNSYDNKDHLQSCSDSQFQAHPGFVDSFSGERLNIACIGRQACEQTHYESAMPPVDLCCNGVQTCKDMGHNSDQLGPPDDSTAECRDDVPNNDDSNDSQTCYQAEFTNRDGGKMDVCCVDPGDNVKVCEDLCNDGAEGCTCAESDISWCDQANSSWRSDDNFGNWECSAK